VAPIVKTQIWQR